MGSFKDRVGIKNKVKLSALIILAMLSLSGCTTTADSVSTETQPQTDAVKAPKTDAEKPTVAKQQKAPPSKPTQSVQKQSSSAPQPPNKKTAARYDSYIEYPDAQAMMLELQEEGFSETYLFEVFSEAKRQESILEAISRPAEKSLNWGQYRNIFLKPKRIERGVEFWEENQAALIKAEQEYGVPAEIIVAIIGVETHYGRITGSYRVVDALATLGFDYPRRGAFFQKQLKEYLRLVREEQTDFKTLKGSYAGAMGYGQFIPSSYRSYAIDFDGDGKRDIWNNKTDAIGSVANYFAEHKWKPGQPVISAVTFNTQADEAWYSKGRKGLIPKVTVAEWKARGVQPAIHAGEEGKAILMQLQIGDDYQYWMGLHNFYVITRYNHSKLYAMAVYRLSERIKQAYEAKHSK